MQLEGFLNNAHLLRVFLSHEYAFEIAYEGKRTVKVTFHKGIWYLVKAEDGKVVDVFNMNDVGAVNQGSSSFFNDMTQALVESIWDVEEQAGSEPDYREKPANVLEKVLGIWGKSPEKIEKISVLQPGRNSSPEPVTYETILAPRMEAWMK